MIDIPFILWAFGIIIAFAFSAFGFIAKPRIHAMIIATALFLALFTLVTDNLVMGYEVHPDITENTGTQVFVYDVSPDSRDKLYSGYKKIVAIEIGSNSSLIGERTNSVQFYLAKTSTAPTTVPVKFGIFNSTGHMQIQLGPDITISTINTDYLTPQFRQFTLGSYIIQPGDYIGFQWLDNTSTSVNHLWYGYSISDAFDGADTTLAYMNNVGDGFTNTNSDLAGSIIKSGTSNISDVTEFEVTPILYPFDEMPKILFLTISSMLLIASITLMVREQ